MNILLTGANGFLGGYIGKRLAVANEVHSLSRTGSNYNCNLAKEIPSFLRDFDVVIHSAGKAHKIVKNETDIQGFYNVNVTGTLNLLKGLDKREPPKYFVFISSVSVYGLVKGEIISEDHLLLTNDAYGKSKIEAEKIIVKWCNKHNVTCTILRLPLIVGTNPPGNLGAMINSILRGFYFNIDGGTAKKSMVLATDVAKYILRASEVGGIYNLTDGYHPNFNELSDLIAKQLGKKKIKNLSKPIARFIAKVGDILGSRAPINSEKLKKITSTLTFDDSKARAAFGWSPTPVLEGFKIYDDL